MYLLRLVYVLQMILTPLTLISRIKITSNLSPIVILVNGFTVTTIAKLPRRNLGTNTHIITQYNTRSSSLLTLRKQQQKDIDETILLLDVIEINATIDRPFSASQFASTNCWGKRPLLIRGAFTKEAFTCHSNHNEEEEEESPWPSWEEVIEYAMDEDAEARLITHIPNDNMSWKLELDPFLDNTEHDILPKSTSTSTSEQKSTLVLNDVDRYHPPLSDWISNTFSFLPTWRRDDGQISLSHTGGGIGPHVDDYDVFLIQSSGRRTWDVGRKLVSTRAELDGGLIEGLDVRILKDDVWRRTPRTRSNESGENVGDDDLVHSFVLEAGDVLYLPPRVVHCGTALCDSSMTLSVGLRAPSVKEMMIRLVDEIGDSTDGKVASRYQDPELLDEFSVDEGNNNDETRHAKTISSGEISKVHKEKAKQLLKDGIMELLDDDVFFDEFFGKLVTETKRVRMNYPPSLDDEDNNNEYDDDDDDWKESLGVWGDSKTALQAMLRGDGDLYAAEGITWAYSEVSDILNEDCLISRLFIDGKVWEVHLNPNESPNDRLMRAIIQIIANEQKLSRDLFLNDDGILEDIPKRLQNLLDELIHQGFLYGSNE